MNAQASIRECSLCEQPSDTYLRGSAKIQIRNGLTVGPPMAVGLVICSGCVDHLNKRIIERYRKPSETAPVAAEDNGAWSTATWDSD